MLQRVFVFGMFDNIVTSVVKCNCMVIKILKDMIYIQAMLSCSRAGVAVHIKYNRFSVAKLFGKPFPTTTSLLDYGL